MENPNIEQKCECKMCGMCGWCPSACLKIRGHKIAAIIIMILVLVFVAFTFSKCHVMKRTYRNGYYIAWNKKAAHLKNDNSLKNENSELNEIVNYTEPVLSEPVLASTENVIPPIEKKKLII